MILIKAVLYEILYQILKCPQLPHSATVDHVMCVYCRLCCGLEKN